MIILRLVSEAKRVPSACVKMFCGWVSHEGWLLLCAGYSPQLGERYVRSVQVVQTHISSYWKPFAAKVPLCSENDQLETIIHSDAKLNKSSQ